MKKLFSEHRNLAVAIAASILILVGVGIWVLSSDKQSSNNSVSSNAASSAPKTSSAPQTTQLPIKELGVKLTLSAELKGLQYSAVASPANAPANIPTIATLTLKSYTDAVNKCLGVSSDIKRTFATLVSTPGQYNTPGRALPKNSSTKLMKQFNDFHLDRMGSMITTYKCKDPNNQASFDNTNKSLDSALTTSAQAAQPL